LIFHVYLFFCQNDAPGRQLASQSWHGFCITQSSQRIRANAR
jgi:hypothetical protein